MCGVVGIFAFDGQVVSDDALRAATAALEHRGPDAQRTWRSADGRAGLGHTRLRIIDLSSGDQPMTNEAGDVHLVANGEIYDHDRIRRELIARGHVLRTASDSEVILHLYEDYGVDCLRHLRGEFAFVLWDSRNRMVFAARDRFGIKPLYYTRQNGLLRFASEVKALLASGLPAAWDDESLHQMLFSPHPAHRTLFKDVWQVPPGHYVVATPNQFREYEYWDLSYPPDSQAETALPVQEQARLVREGLDEAVRLRLRADVPVAVYLSGGLDSSVLLGMAARHVSTPVTAFTLSFDHPAYDEREFAAESAQSVGASWVPVRVTEQDLADHYRAALFHSEVIPANAHSVAKFVLSRAVRNAGYRVVLTGEGSDEIFAGYPHFRKDHALYDADLGGEGIESRLARLRDTNQASLGMMLSADGHQRIPVCERVLGFTPAFLEAQWSAGVKATPLLRESFRSRMQSRDAIGALLTGIDVDRRMRGRPVVHQSMYLWSKTSLPNYLLNLLGDRMEMAHSVEGRVPFLDHEFVSLVTGLPASSKIHGTTEKYILKEAARPFVTERMYERQKHPFVAPPLSMDGPLMQLVQDTLRGTHAKAQPVFEQARVVGLLDMLPHMAPSDRAALDPALMVLTGICQMQDVFGLQAG